MRINKFIAHSGVASRRKADELIVNEKVSVNGKIVTDFSYEVKEDDIVSVDGEIISKERHIYLMMNKPSKYITAVVDDRGRKTVTDLLFGKVEQRVYPVGRLDYDTEGLLILTNDGDLANKLIHPSSNIPKTYYAELSRKVTKNDISTIEKGVDIGGYITKYSKIKVSEKANACFITIEEGRNRQVRKMFETQGIRVKYLKRISIGDLKLGDLKKGHFRELSKQELDYLKKLK